ncbi:MAG: transcription antitermination factor NusB, partial [Longimicrobiales bacterium]
MGGAVLADVGHAGLSGTPARRAALETLRALRGGDLLDRAFGRASARLDRRDRAWTHELVYGTVRLRGRIDWLLGRVLDRGVTSVQEEVLDVLRLGVYQLHEMGGVPAYAAVSQSVDQAREAAGAGAARLANGVLRRVRREGDALLAELPSFAADPVAHLSTWGAHPRWLVERWIARFGEDAARAIVEANNRRPELFIRPLGVSVADAVGRLHDAGIAAGRVPFAPDAVAVERGASPADVLAMLPAIVQDPAAGLVTRYADLPAGARVADLCAAPGGKSLALADA